MTEGLTKEDLGNISAQINLTAQTRREIVDLIYGSHTESNKFAAQPESIT